MVHIEKASTRVREITTSINICKINPNSHKNNYQNNITARKTHSMLHSVCLYVSVCVRGTQPLLVLNQTCFERESPIVTEMSNSICVYHCLLSKHHICSLLNMQPYHKICLQHKKKKNICYLFQKVICSQLQMQHAKQSHPCKHSQSQTLTWTDSLCCQQCCSACGGPLHPLQAALRHHKGMSLYDHSGSSWSSSHSPVPSAGESPHGTPGAAGGTARQYLQCRQQTWDQSQGGSDTCYWYVIMVSMSWRQTCPASVGRKIMGVSRFQALLYLLEEIFNLILDLLLESCTHLQCRDIELICKPQTVSQIGMEQYDNFMSYSCCSK